MSGRSVVSFVILLGIASSSVISGPAWSLAYPPVQNFQVAMSDGIHLNTDVYFPQTGSGPWPVMFYRTPYDIQTDNIGAMTQYGMAVVCQDTRGRFGSEGLDRVFLDDGWGPDHRDGLETAQWILAQSWCNGRIGTKGMSARGITQNMLAGALPDSVRCMTVVEAPADLYEQLMFPGGAFRQYDASGWLESQGSSYILDSLRAHPDKDGWWAWLDTRLRHSMETIPTYHVGGWFDLFSEGTLASFTGLQEHGGPGAAGRQKLVIGPWPHVFLGTGSVGELNFPDAGMTTPNLLVGSALQWQLYWLLDQPSPIIETPAIAYYVMGDCDDASSPGNEWRTSNVWPPPGGETSLYLHSAGELSPLAPLSGEPPDAYSFDPQNPVPTIGGGNLMLDAGPYDQRPVLSRTDVRVYQTAPLTQPLEASGPVWAELFVSSDRTDTDFTAKLCDVYPDGRAMLICDGILRARHRLSLAAEDFLAPGQIYDLRVNLWDTSIVFNVGHRILLAVSSSNAPRFDVNPNTGAPFMDTDTALVAVNIIHHDAECPSRLILWTPFYTSACQSEPGRLPADPAGLVLFPNPCTGQVTIEYRLQGGGPVSLDVFDLSGRLIRTLLPGQSATDGPHLSSWDARDAVGRPAGSGVYLLRLKSPREQAVRRLLVIH